MSRSLPLAAGAAATIMAGLFQPAHAVDLYATGFEAQQGYSLASEVGGSNGWQLTNGAAQQAFVITDQAAADGTQAVAFNPVANSGQYEIYRSVTSALPSGDTVTIAADFGTSDSGTAADWAVMAALSDTGAFIAQVRVRTSGQVVLGLASSNAPSNVFYAKGFWGHYEMVLDFAAHTVSASFNGQSLGSGSFATSINAIGLFASGISNAQGGTEVGYLDRVRITSAVPEPAAAGLLLGGLVLTAAAVRRRRVAQRVSAAG